MGCVFGCFLASLVPFVFSCAPSILGFFGREFCFPVGCHLWTLLTVLHAVSRFVWGFRFCGLGLSVYVVGRGLFTAATAVDFTVESST